jgi:hypothetical protein
LAGVAACLPATAAVPDWMRAAARAPLPAYKAETKAVILLDEQITTVKDGEIKTVYRRAVRILRPAGAEEHSDVVVHFDNDTKLTFLKAWCIPEQGKDYEVKESDATETGMSESLYTDNRHKVLKIPAAQPGSVVGYEYEQKRRPAVLQDTWWFQEEDPVRTARFVLQLPPGWEYQAVWLHYPEKAPRESGPGQWTWELQDVTAIEGEEDMPPRRAVAGRLAVSYFPSAGGRGASHASWADVGRWYAGLAASSLQPTPAIRNKVQALTAAATDATSKIHALASYAQKGIRYVAIEIGIGGYQPHAAGEILANEYGDCKDKVALLHSMLKEAGFESYFVLVNTTRGAVMPRFPSMLNFNHAIIAVRLPAGAPGSAAGWTHPALGDLLFFDPTDTLIPVGYLPAHLQGAHGLLVTAGGGELIELPSPAPGSNRLLRTAKIELAPDGAAVAEVAEVRWGTPAADSRARFQTVKPDQRQKVIESFLAPFVKNYVLLSGSLGNLDQHDQSFTLNFRFKTAGYAQLAGNLLLFRPRLLGSKGGWIDRDKPRKYPVRFGDISVHTDTYEFAIPSGWQVDELPEPVNAIADFAEYKSKTESDGKVVKYTRYYTVKKALVPVEQLEELKRFYQAVGADETASVVLKRSAP